MSAGHATNVLIGHDFNQDTIASVMDGSTLHGHATIRQPSIGKEGTVIRHGAEVELTITSVVVMHRHVVDDFEHFRPGDELVWYHGPTNRHQTGTIVAWAPEYRINAVGEIICTAARAVIHVKHLTWGMGLGKDQVQLAENFYRYGSGIVMVYR
jgi:hypothetical protein